MVFLFTAYSNLKELLRKKKEPNIKGLENSQPIPIFIV